MRAGQLVLRRGRVIPLGLLVVFWAVVAALAWSDWRRPPTPEDVDAPPRWLFPVLLGLGALTALIRAPLALARTARNVDEYQYQAAGTFAQLPGEGFFSLPHKSFRLHQWIHSVPGDGFTLIDVTTSLVIGVTAALLGWALWKALRRPWAAVAAAVFYPLGILRFEGLTSNAEPYANLFVAAYLVAVFSAPQPTAKAQLVRGLLLGLAGIGKEQALPLLALEPVRLLLPLLHAEERAAFRWKETLRAGAIAVAASLAPLLLYLTGVAVAANAQRVVEDIFLWGTSVGHTRPVAVHRPGFLQHLLNGYRRLVLGPVGLLGILALLRSLYRPKRLLTPESRPLLLVIIYVLISAVLVSLGFRWHGHYYQLAFPGLALLAALSAEDLVRSARAKRWAAAPLVLAVAFVCWTEVDALYAQPNLAQGKELHDAESRAAVRAAGEAVDAAAPADAPIYVWGYRPDLYHHAKRPAASGYTAFTRRFVRVERLAEDFAAHRPAVFVVTPEGQEALEAAPDMRGWLEREGYRPARTVSGYVLWTP